MAKTPKFANAKVFAWVDKWNKICTPDKIVVVKGLSRECDEAAVKVVSSLPRFTPARQQGHPVPVWFTLPIRFQLQ